MVSEPAPGDRPLAVFDLDHTILHMLARENAPDEVAELGEDTVSFQHDDVDYDIALRVGTTSLVTALRQKGVDIAVATCNLLGDEVVAALAKRCDVFEGIPVHVIQSRDKGGKSLKELGLQRPRVVILDDSLNAWVPEDQEFVFTAQRFDVQQLAGYLQQDDDAGDAAVDRELGYLTSIRESLLAFFDGPKKIDFDDDSEPGTPAGMHRSDSLLSDVGSPLARKRSLSEGSGDSSAKRPKLPNDSALRETSTINKPDEPAPADASRP